jgi:hypothetical protein
MSSLNSFSDGDSSLYFNAIKAPPGWSTARPAIRAQLFRGQSDGFDRVVQSRTYGNVSHCPVKVHRARGQPSPRTRCPTPPPVYCKIVGCGLEHFTPDTVSYGNLFYAKVGDDDRQADPSL